MSIHTIPPRSNVDLKAIDPAATPLIEDKQKAKKKIEAVVARLDALQELLYAGGKQKLLVILQGMDTSGKDGAIRQVMSGFDPMGVRVVSFRKPTLPELEHDFLWRVHAQVPARGEIVIFNRSHYEDVLVVRVHSLVPEREWRKRYAQINDFERMLSETGTTILKFFLHISREEQKERLQARVDDPTKRWKFNHGDLEERKLWDDYMRAYEEALEKTSTRWAPWIVVPADRKWYRDYVIAHEIADRLEGLGMTYPEVDLTGVVVE